jgi:hypothetical protein
VTTRLEVLKPETRWKPLAHQLAHATLRDALMPFDSFEAWPTMEDLNALFRSRGLTNASGMPLLCELQAPKTKHRRARPGARSRDSLYDARIDGLGVLPTRAANYHDFFNAMVWLTFPHAKAAIAARQHAIWQRELGPSFEQLPSRRTREQDALAMLDEGGLLVATPRALEQQTRAACEAGDETQLTSLKAVRTYIFGHALHEHMVSSDALIRANPILVLLDEAHPEVDLALARDLRSSEHFQAPSQGTGFFISKTKGAPLEALL